MHDQSYKLLFAHARMVEDLLRGFVPEAWVSDLDFATLERWTVWIKRVVLRDRADDVVWERVNDLEEVQTMLADRVKEWERDWHQRGFAEGIEKGREEKLISERALLGRLANRQFGEGVANQLVELLRQINDSEQLDAIGEWIIVCQTGDELLTQTQQLLVANRNKK